MNIQKRKDKKMMNEKMMKEKMEKRKMMLKKRGGTRMAAACLMMLLMAAGTGCGNDDAIRKGDDILLTEEEADGAVGTEHTISVPETEEPGSAPENEAPGTVTETGIPSSDSGGQEQESISIGGKVRSVEEDSFVISRTLLSEDGVVTMPEPGSPEEDLVKVCCTEATIFAHWTIKGGDIDMKEGFFSQIGEGTGLEAFGYYDGEIFMAEKVIIEIYE